MRILHIHGRYYPEGGGETYLRSLIHSQLETGLEVAVLYADQPRDKAAAPCPTFFRTPSHGLRSGLRALPEFHRVVTNFNPDVIHLHVIQYDISPVILWWLFRSRPTVMTMHDTLTLCPKPIKGRRHELSARIMVDGKPCTMTMGRACLQSGCLSKMLASQGLRSCLVALVEKLWRRRQYRFIDRMIVNSDFSKGELLRNHIPAGKITVIPAPLNIPEEWSHETVSNPRSLPHLLFVGQLSILKGAGEFITVLKQLKDRPWTAGMAGDGPDRCRIEAELKEHGLTERVELHGYVPRKDMGDIYRQASVLVFPTLAPESLGLVGIEAMWFGLPVVAYDVGAINEWLQHGRNGYLVAPGEVDTMALRIQNLLTDTSLYGAFSSRAADSARKWLQTNHCQSAFNSLYFEVTGGGNAHRH